jgi:hypothetical protein
MGKVVDMLAWNTVCAALMQRVRCSTGQQGGAALGVLLWKCATSQMSSVANQGGNSTAGACRAIAGVL